MVTQWLEACTVHAFEADLEALVHSHGIRDKWSTLARKTLLTF